MEIWQFCLYNYYKNYLILKNNSCWTCNISEWNNKPIIFEIEHIDGNSENNKEENLSLICPNCHSQTETYKGKNVGNGRHFRKIRYQQGKSYQLNYAALAEWLKATVL